MVNLDNTSADSAVFFSRLLKAESGEMVTGIEKIPGGINSGAFKISTDHDEYLGKIYPISKGAGRERLAAEFYGLRFLWQNGIRNIPEPLFASQKQHLALYRFIRGRKIRPGEITAADVDEAADFASRVHSLVRSKGADNQPIASEACFSIREYIDCIIGRVDKLEKIIKRDIIFDALKKYLKNEFMPFFDIVRKEAATKAKKSGIDINEKLHKGRRTLSPSDFGFHNTIRSQSGRLFSLIWNITAGTIRRR